MRNGSTTLAHDAKTISMKNLIRLNQLHKVTVIAVSQWRPRKPMLKVVVEDELVFFIYL